MKIMIGKILFHILTRQNDRYKKCKSCEKKSGYIGFLKGIFSKIREAEKIAKILRKKRNVNGFLNQDDVELYYSELNSLGLSFIKGFTNDLEKKTIFDLDLDILKIMVSLSKAITKENVQILLYLKSVRSRILENKLLNILEAGSRMPLNFGKGLDLGKAKKESRQNEVKIEWIEDDQD